jgi:hypothetical protein
LVAGTSWRWGFILLAICPAVKRRTSEAELGKMPTALARRSSSALTRSMAFVDDTERQWRLRHGLGDHGAGEYP